MFDRRKFQRFLAHESGSVLPLAAAGMLVLVGLVGSGVDMARAYKAERRLQSACDAGVLAGRRAVGNNGFDSGAQTQATQFFTANYDREAQQTSVPAFDPVSDDNGNTVEATASATLPTVLMNVFGFGSLDLGVSCSASMGVGNSDIMFVLDNTYSMTLSAGSVSRISALKAAMLSFYDTVNASVSGSNARIRYGMVPYATTVNVGALLNNLDSSYLADSITVPSVRLVNWNPTPINSWTSGTPTYTASSQITNWANTGSQYSTNTACTNALPAATAWTDYGSQVTDSTSYSVENDTGNQIKTMGVHQAQRRTEYRCNNKYRQWRTVERQARSSIYEERTASSTPPAPGAPFADAVLQQRTFNVGTYKTLVATTVPVGISNSGAVTANLTSTATWAGCIMERQTTPAASFSFVSLDEGITPGEALDLDIDMAPTSDPTTKWSPLWPEVTFKRDPANTYQGIASTSATISRTTFNNQRASTYCPYRSLLLQPMDRTTFNGHVQSLETSSLGTYHDTGLLWGARLSSPTGIFADTVNQEPSNGGTVSRHMIFMTDGAMQPTLDVNSMYGIERLDKRITGTGTDTDEQAARHTSRALAICEAIKARGIRLWVIAFGATLTSELIQCASPNSSFQADNATALTQHFQEIANQVGELRVTQ